MPYQSTRTITGSLDKAMDTVRAAFIANGFTLVSATRDEFQVTGPGMRSTRQNPLRGISRATVRADIASITLEAELGGAATLGQFMLWFPLLLGALLTILFGVIWWLAGILSRQPLLILVPLLAVSPWLVIGPLITRTVRERTQRAIETLLDNAVQGSRVD